MSVPGKPSAGPRPFYQGEVAEIPKEWEQEWVRGDEPPPDEPPPYHEPLNLALHMALKQIPKEEGNRWYKLELFAHVDHGSPGWIDGFAAILTPGP